MVEHHEHVVCNASNHNQTVNTAPSTGSSTQKQVVLLARGTTLRNRDFAKLALTSSTHECLVLRMLVLESNIFIGVVRTPTSYGCLGQTVMLVNGHQVSKFDGSQRLPDAASCYVQAASCFAWSCTCVSVSGTILRASVASSQHA